MPAKKRRLAKSAKADAEKALSKAASLRASGELNEAEALLKQYAGTSSAAGQAAAYELALLLSQRGCHSEADEWLRRLGFKFKLSPAILSGQGVSVGSDPGADGLTRVYDSVLPADILEALRHAFQPSSCFWSEHEYPTPSFFSYNERLDGSAALYPAIQAAAVYLKPLVERFLRAKHGDQAPAVASVEWWAHRRDIESGGGHQLHFDLDEAGLASVPVGGRPGHPLVSSVLYLSQACDDLASTLVTDQNIDTGSAASKAWLCPPALNRLLFLGGDLLHGVVPRLPRSGSKASPRLTLMLGFWGQAPAPALSPSPSRRCDGLGPNMSGPGPESTWPKLFQLEGAATKSAASSGKAESAVLRGPISPVWVPIDADADGETAQKSGEVEFVGRWFLDHHPSKLQELAVAEARRSLAPPEIEVEEMSMADLARLRGESAVEASAPPSVLLEDVEEFSLADLQKLRGLADEAPVAESELTKLRAKPSPATGKLKKKGLKKWS